MVNEIVPGSKIDEKVGILINNIRAMGNVYKANGVQTNDAIALYNFYLQTIPHPVPPDSLFLMATAEDPECDQGRYLWRYLSFGVIAAWPPQIKRRGSLRAEAPGIVIVQILLASVRADPGVRTGPFLFVTGRPFQYGPETRCFSSRSVE